MIYLQKYYKILGQKNCLGRLRFCGRHSWTYVLKSLDQSSSSFILFEVAGFEGGYEGESLVKGDFVEGRKVLEIEG